MHLDSLCCMQGEEGPQGPPGEAGDKGDKVGGSPTVVPLSLLPKQCTKKKLTHTHLPIIRRAAAVSRAHRAQSAKRERM